MRAHILFHVIFGAFVNVQGFYFSTTTPTQCGDFHVSWTGGQVPFSLTVVPVFGTQTVYNLSDSAFNNGVGTFNTTLTLPEKQQLVVVMSDATGFATGGISPLLTVGPASLGETCNTSQADAQFYFTIDNTLEECRPFTFSEYPNATQPVTIYAVVPGGSGIEFNPPTGPEFVWNPANVPANTSMLFYMTDAQSHTGGASGIMVSHATGDTSCINSTSPSTTGVAASSTLIRAPTSTSSPVSGSKKISAGVISGIVVGGMIGLIGFAALVAFLFRRRNYKSSTPPLDNHHMDIDEVFHEDPELLSRMQPFPAPGPRDSSVLLISHGLTPSTSSSSHVTHSPPAETQSVAVSAVALPLPPMPSSSRSRKSSPRSRASSSPRPSSSTGTGTRVIVHRDGGEVIHEADEDEAEVVELPPRYEDSQRSLFRGAASSETPSSGDSPLPS